MDQELTNEIQSLIGLSGAELRQRLQSRFGRPFRVDYTYSPKLKGPIVMVQDLTTAGLMKIGLAEFQWCQSPLRRLEDRIMDRMNHADFDNGTIKGKRNNDHQKAEDKRIRELTERNAGFRFNLG